jgi:hypothetical protein
MTVPGTTLFATDIDADAFQNTTFDYNVYWTTASAPSSLTWPPDPQAPITWQQWQAQGQDPHSVVQDPQFTTFPNLAPSSPALALGFQPIDISDVGPRPYPGTIQ